MKTKSDLKMLLNEAQAMSRAFETLISLAQTAISSYMQNGKRVTAPDHATRRKAVELLQTYAETFRLLRTKPKTKLRAHLT